MSQSTCSIEGCTKAVGGSRGWCPMHYQRWRHHGHFGLCDPKPTPTCNADGCERPRHNRGLCTAHWHAWKINQGETTIPGSPFIFVGRIYKKARVCHRPTCLHPAPKYWRGKCQKCAERDWRESRVEHRRKLHKRWADENREQKAHSSRQSWLRQYGLTVATWEWLYESQAGKCAICAVELERRGRGTHVDHDHTTGIVRGLLCRRCNRALGLLKDDETVLASAIRYLRRHKARIAA